MALLERVEDVEPDPAWTFSESICSEDRVQPNGHEEQQARNSEVGEWRSGQLAQRHPDQVPVGRDNECGPSNGGVHANKRQEGNEQPYDPAIPRTS